MVKSTTSLTFYGGVDEIGGNKILLQDRGTRVFFDFGMSFGQKKQFYSPPFLSPKSEVSLQELGILPKIEGLYKFDKAPPQADAVFISHGHLDHTAYLSFIKREIPVYCGETTRTILQTLGEVRRQDLEFSVKDISFQAFRTGDKIRVGTIEVEPVHVDHSVPGAYGFVIHTSNGSVVYTGDFRDHGAKPGMTQDFVEAAKTAEPVAVVTEATNMTGASVSNEVEVQAKLNSIISQANGVVLAEFGYSDVDRLNSFFSIAKKNGRCLAVSLRQAKLLDALRSDKHLAVPDLSDPNLMVFRKSKQRYERWERALMERFDGEDKVFDVFEASKRQCRLVLALSFHDFEELVALEPEAGSCYVLSASEPFNEEMELDFERLVNWLRHYGLPQYHVHVSGHMMPLQLKAALKAINSKKLFPVHTEQADLFAGFMRDLKSQTIPTQKNKEYLL
ncbi:MAG: MBL fold metallo-hydrolase [Candidatus Bathyarchaeota archaeon]|nr:MBL fold metallo-hydrolase [Candidatus Bathyarchaeota archaeon]